ncbi:MAG: hypothetical protein HC906_13115 [Bacteroidales bacterium]|nr:hypothetical protein [Bacteroidales bacterium]
MFKTISENLKKGKKEGIYREELDEEIISLLHLSRIERVPEDKVIPVYEYISPRSCNEIFEYHIRGIANEKGIVYLEKKLQTNQTGIKTIIS